MSDLIFEISKINDLKRIRYTTSHPIDFTDDLIEAHKTCKKLMPLIHLPVQSGSDKILKKMNRKHSVENYINIINKLIHVNPNIKFSSDFIIGYPDETEDDFSKTLEIMNKVKFINSYSFIFSARPGTPAFKFKKVNENIAKKRLSTFQAIAEKIKIDYRKQLLGKKISVLFENLMKNENKYFGRDEYFNSVVVESNEDLTGMIKDIEVIEINRGTLFGKLYFDQNKKGFAA